MGEGNQGTLLIGQYRDQRGNLNLTFATEFRYPGDAFEPSAEEAANALTLAEELTAWIADEFSKLPLPRPPNNL